MNRPLSFLATLCLFVSGATAGTLLPGHSTWRYEATGTDLGTAWRDTAHADGGWASGPGELGYGDSFIDTVIPFGSDPNDKQPTSYFRTTFAHDGSTPSSLEARVNYDDGFILYLNGQEVARANLTDPVAYATYANASHEGGAYTTVDLSAYTGLLVPGTNHLAAEVHQRAANSSDLAWDLQLDAVNQSAEITRGPYLQAVSDDEVTFRWRTASATDGRVRMGAAPGAWSFTVDDATVTTEHVVTVSGLAANALYYYSVGSTSTPLTTGTDYRVRTHPVPGTEVPFRVWAIGDAGTADANAASVRDGFRTALGTQETHVWLMLGDNAYNTGTDLEYQGAVFDMYPAMLRSTPLWPTRGNHDDLHTGPDNDYYDIFTLPTAAEAGGLPSGTEAYYSFDYANVHFVCLDSDGSDLSPGGAMFQWLTADLAATSQPWIVAFWHHPPYSKGSHDSDIVGESGGRLEDMRQNALPILEAGGVDLILCGHSHSYERSYLIDGHYGLSSTFHDSMLVDGGTGDPQVDGAYFKPTASGPHQGAIYVVAGSSGKISGGTLDHPVMVTSLNQLGSVLLEVNGSQLDARFLGTAGQADDGFTIIKGVPTSVDSPVPEANLVLGSRPNPFAAATRLSFTLPDPGPARLVVMDVTGRRVRQVFTGRLPAGGHEIRWDGRDDHGRSVAAGLYFAVLEYEGGRRVRKLVLRP